MKKVTAMVGLMGTKMRHRSRSVRSHVPDIARAARSKAPQSKEKLANAYRKLLDSMGRVLRHAKRFQKFRLRLLPQPHDPRNRARANRSSSLLTLITSIHQ